MAWEKLREDYTDAIWAGLKKFYLIENDDGTVSFNDVTIYSQRENSFFGAKDANRIDEAVNFILASLEKGTDLYSGFKEFADNQKELFVEYIQAVEETLEPLYRERIEKFEQDQEIDFRAWFDSIKDILDESTAGHLLKLIQDENLAFYNKTATFTSDATYEDYPYKADIPCEGVTTDYIPTVNLSMEDATSGNISPIAISGDGIVTIYSSENTSITIPTILCTKGGE